MPECRAKGSNKRILVLANNDVGLYQFRKELLFELMDQGHEVTISLPDGELVAPLVEVGCRFIDTSVDRRGINPVTDLKLFWAYLKMMKQLKPDLVITYTIKPNIYGGLACRFLKIPYAANITGLGTAFQREGALKKLVIALYRMALRRASITFFENSANQNLFISEKILPRDRTKLLNGAGVNINHYSMVPYPEEKTTHFLFIGRVMKEKGIDELFAAMNRLRDEGKDCVLDVVGPYEDDYEQQIKGCMAKGWLNYHGFQKDVRPFIKASHCFVLPSWHEGMANTNLECAASGRPVITSNIPGCREAVIPVVSGLLCESQNADSLYQAMKAFLAMPHEQRKAMGREGRKHMEVIFDKQKVVEETIRGLGL